MILRIFEHIENLARDPVPHDAYKLASAENLYRIRVGDYRIIYQVLHESRELTVIYIRHRSVAYRGL